MSSPINGVHITCVLFPPGIGWVRAGWELFPPEHFRPRSQTWLHWNSGHINVGAAGINTSTAEGHSWNPWLPLRFGG